MRNHPHIMSRRLTLTAIACGVLLFQACTLHAGTGGGPLAIRITAPVEEMLVRENLPIDVEWRVVGDDPVHIADADGVLRSARAFIRVLAPRGRSFVIRQVDPNPTMLGAEITIERKPGELWSEIVILNCAWPDPDVAIFDKAGKFEIWAEYNDGTIEAESNHIFVQVREPQEVAEKKALALVRTLEPAGVLYHPAWAVTPQGEPSIDIIMQIVEIEEATVYPAYAALALATRHLRRASSARYLRQENIDVKEELEKAKAFLEKVDPVVKSLEPLITQLQKQVEFETIRLRETDPEYQRLQQLESQIRKLVKDAARDKRNGQAEEE